MSTVTAPTPKKRASRKSLLATKEKLTHAKTAHQKAAADTDATIDQLIAACEAMLNGEDGPDDNADDDN